MTLQAQTVLYTEDFEGTVGTTYTVSPSFEFNGGAQVLVNPQWINNAVFETGDTPPVPFYTNISGTKIIYANSIANITGSSGEASLTTQSIDVTGFTDLEISLLFGANAGPGIVSFFEGPAETGASTTEDKVVVEYRYGSDAYQTAMQFLGRNCTTNSDDGAEIYEDTDLDGTASDECSVSGAAATTAMATFSESVSNSSGTSMNVRIRFISDESFEHFAVDLLKVTAADNSPPVVQSIAPDGSPAANASSMNFLVTFDDVASGVTADDFTLTKTSSANGTIGTPTTSDGGTTWTVPISSISGAGTLRLDLNASTNIQDAAGNGNGTNGHVSAFSSGTTHTVDLVAPTVTSIVRSNPTDATTGSTSVVFRVTFSENVNNISTADFAISGAGAGGTASISSLSTITSSTVFDVTVGSLNTAGELDLDFSGSQDIADDNGNDFGGSISSEETYTLSFAPSSVTVAAKVFLEGAFNGTDLNTLLNSDIPLTQPYTNNGHSGGSAVSIPANAVDWVLVELREAGSAAAALNSTKVGSTAGFLMNDGTIKATDGTSDLIVSLSGNSGADFFVVIYHRNHLPIMSASAVSESGGTYTIDFTSSSANTHQTTTALAALSGGKFGMPSGDADGDGDVDGTDLTTWQSQNGSGFTYNTTNADFNLDGIINAIDRNLFWKGNNAVTKTSQVPTT